MSKENWEYFLNNQPLLKKDDVEGIEWAKKYIEELEAGIELSLEKMIEMGEHISAAILEENTSILNK